MFSLNRHCITHLHHIPAKAGILKRQKRSQLSLGCGLFVLFAMTLALGTNSFAKDKKEPEKKLSDIIEESTLPEGAVKYAPENCDFEMVFPSEPYETLRCGDDTKKCTQLTSYTMVYDVTTTVEVSATCVPSTPEQYKSFTKPVIATALKGMVKRNRVTEHEINTLEKDDVRQGSLLGATKRGKQNSIYNAQLWVGQNSVLTLEAKIIGPRHDKADTAFGDILGSVKAR